MPFKISYVFVAALCAFGCTRVRTLTSNDFVGTWAVDSRLPSIQWYELPANYYEFQITLNSDATFVARNVPEEIFDPLRAAAEYRGTWSMKFEEEDRYRISLSFTEGQLSYSTFSRISDARRTIKMVHGNQPFFLTKCD